MTAAAPVKPPDANPTVKPSAVSNVTPIQFLRNSLKTDKNTQVNIKQVTTHFFRVNYYQVAPAGECVIRRYNIVDSRFYEVVEIVEGYELVDRTIRTGTVIK